MEAKNFRIGNLVYYNKYTRNGEDRNFFVRDLYFENDKIGLTTGKIQTTVDMENIKPIKLTERLINRLGFKQVYESDFSKTFECEQDFSFEFKWNKTFGLFLKYKGETLKNIIYVHQLQNVFFAITNTELELKQELSACS